MAMAGIMKRIIFNIYFWLMFIIVTLLGLICLPFFLIVYTVFLKRTVDYTIRWAICIYGYVLVKVVPFFAPVKVESHTWKFPLPAILVPNHNSAVDPYLFGALLTDVCFVTSWSFRIPVYSFFMHLAGYINVNEGWERICEQSNAILKSGASLIIWPEGHRSRDGRLGRFKNGAFAIAVKTGYPLIPVCILGSGEFLPPGKRLISPRHIKLILLDPVYPDLFNDPQQEIIRLRNAVQKVIDETLRENNEKDLIYNLESIARGEKC
jgi:1-acyl-sn-glycerol-3-phosphate acyltransferase